MKKTPKAPAVPYFLEEPGISAQASQSAEQPALCSKGSAYLGRLLSAYVAAVFGNWVSD